VSQLAALKTAYLAGSQDLIEVFCLKEIFEDAGDVIRDSSSNGLTLPSDFFAKLQSFRKLLFTLSPGLYKGIKLKDEFDSLAHRNAAEGLLKTNVAAAVNTLNFAQVASTPLFSLSNLAMTSLIIKLGASMDLALEQFDKFIKEDAVGIQQRFRFDPSCETVPLPGNSDSEIVRLYFGCEPNDASGQLVVQ